VVDLWVDSVCGGGSKVTVKAWQRLVWCFLWHSLHTNFDAHCDNLWWPRQLKHRPAFLMMARRSLGDETVVHKLGLCVPLQNTQVGSFLGLSRVPLLVAM